MDQDFHSNQITFRLKFEFFVSIVKLKILKLK